MADFMMLMHDTGEMEGHPDWRPYLSELRAKGVLQGGSAMGQGVCVVKSGEAPPISRHITGYIKITADSLETARALLAGNPVYEGGGAVEIRALPVTG